MSKTDSGPKSKDDVYRERNLLALAFIKAYVAAFRHPIPCGWWPDTDDVNGPEWAVVWVDTHRGQVGYHVPRDMARAARWLPKRDPDYDGYSTELKNARVAAVAGVPP